MASTVETVSQAAQNCWPKTSPWGKVHKSTQPSSFTSVMDEQLAKDLQVSKPYNQEYQYECISLDIYRINIFILLLQLLFHLISFDQSILHCVKMMSSIMMILIVGMMRKHLNLHRIVVTVVRRRELKNQVKQHPLNMILMSVEDDMLETWRRLY